MQQHEKNRAAPEPHVSVCNAQQEQQQQQQEGEQHDDIGHRRRAWMRNHAIRMCIGVATAVAAAAVVYLWNHQPPQPRNTAGRTVSRVDRGSSAGSSDGEDDVRIPLPEVVRFKEQQWFVEELEASRHGDPNSMLRLAKMYLHGQGCTQNIFMAQEWLRKARANGIYGTLDELWAGAPSELDQLKTQMKRASAVGQVMLAQRKVTQNGVTGVGYQ